MGLFDIFKADNNENSNTNENIVYAPMTGEAKNISECEDPVFAQEIVGKGTMIIPSEGKLYAPVDGNISMVADTGHALGITSKSGLEILIHIGLDTVELQGGPFDVKVSQDQNVKKGDLLLEFDIEQIKANGKSTQSPVIITNPDNYEISVLKTGNLSHGDELIEAK
ncbi:PTS glucose transporter subunit IIA [Anaerococcus martiniensis]|uniref:PTS sugar transporter subunit IIA n=1 Tax=Anaerococcus sp. WGS1579 TaxID=3366809 RepID=UPI00372D6550